MVGGPALHRLAKELEAQAEAGALGAIEARVGELEGLLGRFLEETASLEQG
jgi:hypothetical protein